VRERRFNEKRALKDDEKNFPLRRHPARPRQKKEVEGQEMRATRESKEGPVLIGMNPQRENISTGTEGGGFGKKEGDILGRW